MMPDSLSPAEREILLKLAREAMTAAVNGHRPGRLDLDGLPDGLKQPGVAFVTLTEEGELRGCIGALEPYQPLAEDVCEHAAAAATQDWRFEPVRPYEVARIHIEISRLTVPQPLAYDGPVDLLSKLRPAIDGVVIKDGSRRATFLPQVWEKLPDPADFLNHLCQKMGAAPDLWRRKPLAVLIYQVEEFQE